MEGIRAINGNVEVKGEQTSHQTNTPVANNTGGWPSVFGNGIDGGAGINKTTNPLNIFGNGFDGNTGTGAHCG